MFYEESSEINIRGLHGEKYILHNVATSCLEKRKGCHHCDSKYASAQAHDIELWHLGVPGCAWVCLFFMIRFLSLRTGYFYTYVQTELCKQGSNRLCEQSSKLRLPSKRCNKVIPNTYKSDYLITHREPGGAVFHDRCSISEPGGS